MNREIYGITLIIILIAGVFSGCIPSAIEEVENQTIITSMTSTPTLKPSPTISAKATSTSTNTEEPGTLTQIPSPMPSSTPPPIAGSTMIAFIYWDGRRSNVLGIQVGCLDEPSPCFGELEILFEVQGIEILENRWSPDGKKLAFEGRHQEGKEMLDDLFVIDVDGQHLNKITNVTPVVIGSEEFRTVAKSPLWSSDGHSLAFNLCNLGCKVFVTNIETGETNQLLEQILKKTTLIEGWLSKSERMVFTMDDVNGVSQVFTSDLDGANITQVTDNLEENYSAIPSLDENWLLVNRESSNDELFPSDLFIIKLDGSQEIRITDDDLFYYECSWSPNNYWIVAGSTSGPDTSQIILINIEGDLIKLDLEPGKYSYPTWRSFP